MGSLIKLPVFLFASAIALFDERKGSSASTVNIASSEAHIALSVEPVKKAGAKVWSNNLAAKLSEAAAGPKAPYQGQPIGRLSENKKRSIA